MPTTASFLTSLLALLALQAKKMVENALLSKLQEAQGQVEETKAALALAEERAASLETERARQGAAVSALTKQLQDANRSGKREKGGTGLLFQALYTATKIDLT